MNLTLFCLQTKGVALSTFAGLVDHQSTLYINSSQPAAQIRNIPRHGHFQERSQSPATMMRGIPCGYAGPSYSTYIRIAHLRDITTRVVHQQETYSFRYFAFIRGVASTVVGLN